MTTLPNPNTASPPLDDGYLFDDGTFIWEYKILNASPLRFAWLKVNTTTTYSSNSYNRNTFLQKADAQLTGNLVVSTTNPAGIVANGSIGEYGQLLTSNGTSVFWGANTDDLISNSYFSNVIGPSSNSYITNTFASNSYSQITFVSNNYFSQQSTSVSNNYATQNLTSNNYVINTFTSNAYITTNIVSNSYVVNVFTSNNFAINTFTSNDYIATNITSNSYIRATYTSNSYVVDRIVSNNYLMYSPSLNLLNGLLRVNTGEGTYNTNIIIGAQDYTNSAGIVISTGNLVTDAAGYHYENPNIKVGNSTVYSLLNQNSLSVNGQIVSTNNYNSSTYSSNSFVTDTFVSNAYSNATFVSNNYLTTIASPVSNAYASGTYVSNTYLSNNYISGSSSNGQVLFNDGGYVNSTAGLTFNKSSNTLTIGNNLYIGGNIYVTGNVTTFAANNLQIVDNMFYLNSNSDFNNPDIGFAANYNDGSYHHTGFFRDHSTGRWKVFENYLPEPQASQYIDQSNNTFRLADFQANTIYAANNVYANLVYIGGDLAASNTYLNNTFASNNYTSNVFTSNNYVQQIFASNNYLSTIIIPVSNSYANATFTSNNYIGNFITSNSYAIATFSSNNYITNIIVSNNYLRNSNTQDFVGGYIHAERGPGNSNALLKIGDFDFTGNTGITITTGSLVYDYDGDTINYPPYGILLGVHYENPNIKVGNSTVYSILNQNSLTVNGQIVATNNYNRATYTSNSYIQYYFVSNSYGTITFTSNNYIQNIFVSNSYANATYTSNSYVLNFIGSNSYNQSNFVSNNYLSTVASPVSNSYATITFTSNNYVQNFIVSNSYAAITYTTNNYIISNIVSNNYTQNWLVSNTYANTYLTSNSYALATYTTNNYIISNIVSNNYTQNWLVSNTYANTYLASNSYVAATYGSNNYNQTNFVSNNYLTTIASPVSNGYATATFAGNNFTTTNFVSNNYLSNKYAALSGATFTGSVTVNNTFNASGNTTIGGSNPLSSITYTGLSANLYTQEASITGIFFSTDGLNAYITGTNSDRVYQYSLGTPWDISTFSYNGANLNLSSQDTSPNDLYISPDGINLYISGLVTDKVEQYIMTIPWDIRTASYSSKFLPVIEDSAPTGVTFKSDGTKVYASGAQNQKVYQYTLGTAWDVSTAAYDIIFLNVSAQETYPSSIRFNDTGSQLYVLGNTGIDIVVYNLSTPWNIGTSSFAGNVSVARQETTPTGLYVKPGANKIYVAGKTNDTVYEYSSNTGIAQLTVSGDLYAYGNVYVYQSLNAGVVNATNINATTNLTIKGYPVASNSYVSSIYASNGYVSGIYSSNNYNNAIYASNSYGVSTYVSNNYLTSLAASVSNNYAITNFTSNNYLNTANLIFNGNVTVLNTFTVGTNTTITTGLITVGNTTVNTQIYAGNVYLNGSTLVVGNTAANVTINGIAIAIGSTVVINSTTISINSSVLTSNNYATNWLVSNTYANAFLTSNSYAVVTYGSNNYNQTNFVSNNYLTTIASPVSNGYATATYISNNYGTTTLISNNYLYAANLVFTGNTTFNNTNMFNGNVIVQNTITVGTNTNINSNTITIGTSSVNATMNSTAFAVNGLVLASNNYVVNFLSPTSNAYINYVVPVSNSYFNNYVPVSNSYLTTFASPVSNNYASNWLVSNTYANAFLTSNSYVSAIYASNSYTTAIYVSNNYLYTANIVYTGNVTVLNTFTVGTNTTITSNSITIGTSSANATMNSTTFAVNGLVMASNNYITNFIGPLSNSYFNAYVPTSNAYATTTYTSNNYITNFVGPVSNSYFNAYVPVSNSYLTTFASPVSNNYLNSYVVPVSNSYFNNYVPTSNSYIQNQYVSNNYAKDATVGFVSNSYYSTYVHVSNSYVQTIAAGTLFVSNAYASSATGLTSNTYVTSFYASNSYVQTIAAGTSFASNSYTQQTYVQKLQPVFTGNVTFTVGGPIGLIANGSIGTPGQVLISNSTGLYWDSNTVTSNNYATTAYVSNNYFSTSVVGTSNNYITNNLVSNNYAKDATVGFVSNAYAKSAAGYVSNTYYRSYPEILMVPMSDEITALQYITAGSSTVPVIKIHIPYAMTLISPYVRLTASKASDTGGGSIGIDIKITSTGASLFSGTKPSLGTGANTNLGTIPTLTTTTLNDGEQLQFYMTSSGTNALGLKATLYYIRTT